MHALASSIRLYGDIPTFIFMPVGTKATVKGLMTDTVQTWRQNYWQIRTIRLSAQEMAGCTDGWFTTFMQWYGPILTDSRIPGLSHEFRSSDEGVKSAVDTTVHASDARN